MGPGRRGKSYVIARLDRAMEISQLRARVGELEEKVDRLSAQLAAAEERLADRIEPAVTADTSEPSTLLAEARAEHRRMRTRLGLVTNYVSRLERLERAVFRHEPDAHREVADGDDDRVERSERADVQDP